MWTLVELALKRKGRESAMESLIGSARANING